MKQKKNIPVSIVKITPRSTVILAKLQIVFFIPGRFSLESLLIGKQRKPVYQRLATYSVVKTE